MADSARSKTVDLTLGVAADSLSSGGALLGRVRDDDVLLACAGDRLFAVEAHFTHYHGALVATVSRDQENLQAEFELEQSTASP